jgi:serine/threonine protein kinase
VMSKAASSYVVQVYGFSSYDTVLTIVMEYMENGDLFTVLHKKKIALSKLQCLLMAHQIASGLALLHSNNILHRDIKSMNILVNDKFDCKLTDFGMSKLIGDQDIFNTANAGTPLWMAPEVRGGLYQFSADVYSLGLVLFEVFEQRLPDWDRTKSCVVLPSSYSSSSIVKKCIEAEPESRIKSMDVVKLIEELVGQCLANLKKNCPEYAANVKSDMVEDLRMWCTYLKTKSNTEIECLIEIDTVITSETLGHTTPTPINHQVNHTPTPTPINHPSPPTSINNPGTTSINNPGSSSTKLPPTSINNPGTTSTKLPPNSTKPLPTTTKLLPPTPINQPPKKHARVISSPRERITSPRDPVAPVPIVGHQASPTPPLDGRPTMQHSADIPKKGDLNNGPLKVFKSSGKDAPNGMSPSANKDY